MSLLPPSAGSPVNTTPHDAPHGAPVPPQQGAWRPGPEPAPQAPWASPAPSSAPNGQQPKKPLYKRGWFIALAVLVVVGVIGSTAAGSRSNDAAPIAAQPDSSVDGNVDGAPEDEATADVESETAPPPAPPPAPPVNTYDEQFGTFAPISASGASDSIVELPVGARAGIVVSSYSGSGNFAILGLDVNNQTTADLLANAIGQYAGSAPYGLSGLGTPVRLQITASGPWTLSISPVSAAAPMTLPLSGVGAGVYVYDGPAGAVSMSHDGLSNFAVIQYGGLFPNLMANEIGAYNGVVPVQSGPSVIVITADGNWTIAGA